MAKKKGDEQRAPRRSPSAFYEELDKYPVLPPQAPARIVETSAP